MEIFNSYVDKLVEEINIIYMGIKSDTWDKLVVLLILGISIIAILSMVYNIEPNKDNMIGTYLFLILLVLMFWGIGAIMYLLVENIHMKQKVRNVAKYQGAFFPAFFSFIIIKSLDIIYIEKIRIIENNPLFSLLLQDIKNGNQLNLIFTLSILISIFLFFLKVNFINRKIIYISNNYDEKKTKNIITTIKEGKKIRKEILTSKETYKLIIENEEEIRTYEINKISRKEIKTSFLLKEEKKDGYRKLTLQDCKNKEFECIEIVEDIEPYIFMTLEGIMLAFLFFSPYILYALRVMKKIMDLL